MTHNIKFSLNEGIIKLLAYGKVINIIDEHSFIIEISPHNDKPFNIFVKLDSILQPPKINSYISIIGEFSYSKDNFIVINSAKFYNKWSDV